MRRTKFMALEAPGRRWFSLFAFMSSSIRLLLLGFVLSSAAATTAIAKESTPSAEPAEIEVDGLGWWRDRQQEQSLRRLLGDELGSTLEVNAIEDAVFLLLSSLTEDGYLAPVVTVEVTGVDGQQSNHTFDATLETSLPRSIVAKRVRLDVDPGVRFVFEAVNFSGLQALEEDVARQFFMGEPVLISRKSSRVYSPALLRRAVTNLEQELQRLGYTEARVTAEDLRMDRKTGEVDVKVAVVQGPRWLVTAVRVEGVGNMAEVFPSMQNFTGEPWSELWRQNVATEIRNHFYRRGYPDVTVRVEPDAGEARAGAKAVAVVARVNTGPAVTVGEPRIEGAVKTAESVLRRRIDSEPGQPLDPLAIEQARFRLARLGIFDSVDLRYEPRTGLVRDPVFTVREGREMEANLLFGYGSYEQLRGGIEWRRWNLFGHAHQSRLLLLQSMKSTRGEYSYTVPEIFGESIDGTARLFGLQRQETSFLRQEYGATFAVSTHVPWIGANARLGYTFQSLRNQDNTLESSPGDLSQVNAASFDLNLVRDRRDNPLRPRNGYRWFLQAEMASRYFGGTVDYQRTEFGGSYHTPWGRGRWVHVGLNHGVVTTVGSDDTDLPVNKRFFPGGDNSIRGYQEGEAAPFGAEGGFVGAKSYLLLNLELEQALTTKWSAVLFFDALGIAARLGDYPFSEKLYSVGLGVRYQTIIGPLRIEYGRNISPRPTDPSGSLLFSVGFPF
jgi:outer membrane protein assembly complex protein YaeT